MLSPVVRRPSGTACSTRFDIEHKWLFDNIFVRMEPFIDCLLEANCRRGWGTKGATHRENLEEKPLGPGPYVHCNTACEAVTMAALAANAA